MLRKVEKSADTMRANSLYINRKEETDIACIESY